MVRNPSQLLSASVFMGLLTGGGVVWGQVPPMVSSQPVTPKPPASQPATAPSTPASATARRVITAGFVRADPGSPWQAAVADSVHAEAENRGVTLKVLGAASQEGQVEALRALIAAKMDALILAPLAETGWDAVLREAKAAQIPVFLVGGGIRTTEGGAVKTVVMSDPLGQGRMVAGWLAEKTEGRCNFVELQGPAEAAMTIDRKRGLEQIIQDEFPNLVVLKSQSADGARAKGNEVMESFLKAEGKHIQAVFAHNDDMALGAVEALAAAGFKPGHDVLIISIDATKPALEAIVQGKLNASIECNPVLGPLVFDALITTVRGGKVPYKILVKDELFDATSAKDRLAARPY